MVLVCLHYMAFGIIKQMDTWWRSELKPDSYYNVQWTFSPMDFAHKKSIFSLEFKWKTVFIMNQIFDLEYSVKEKFISEKSLSLRIVANLVIIPSVHPNLD